MIIHIKIIGVFLITLSLVHVIFPSYFDWKNDLKHIKMINREMMWVHTFFVALAVFLMGILCLINTDDLVNTSLGKNICLGFGIFWTIRLAIQFWGYSTALWKGKKFETAIHIFFSFLWLYFSVIFLNVSLSII